MDALKFGDKTCSYPLQLEFMLPIISWKGEGGINEEVCLLLLHMLFSLSRLGAIYLENHLRHCMWKPESLTGTITMIYNSILVYFIDWHLGQLLTGLTHHLALHSSHLVNCKDYLTIRKSSKFLSVSQSSSQVQYIIKLSGYPACCIPTYTPY